MAITPWQAGGILNPQEYFGREEYGKLGPKITTPSLLGAGVLGDVAGKKGKIRRGNEIYCPTGTQPNASNTACVPITDVVKKCPDGTTGVWPNCKPIIGNTCPDGTTGVWPDCKPIGEDRGCIYGRDKYGNCIDPTGKSDWYDYVAPGMEPWAKATGPEPGGGPEDWRGDSAGFGTDIGSRVGNAIVTENERGIRGLEFGGLSPQDEKDFQAALTAQRTTPSILSGQTGYYVPQGFDDFGAMSTPGIQSFPNERPAPLSTQDFLAQYSRPPKTVDQGILGPSQEAAAARRIEDVYGMDNILAPAPVKPVVDRGPSVDDFSDFEEQRVERQVEEAKEQSKAQKSAKKKLEKIKESQAADKKKADDKRKADEKKQKAYVASLTAFQSAARTKNIEAEKKQKERSAAAKKKGYATGPDMRRR